MNLSSAISLINTELPYSISEESVYRRQAVCEVTRKRLLANVCVWHA